MSSSRRPTSYNDFGDRSASREICNFYRRGNCKFGNDCKLSHDIAADTRGDYPRRDDYSRDRRDDYPPRDRRDDFPPRGEYSRRDDYPPRNYDRRDDYPPPRDRRDDYPPPRDRRDDYPPRGGHDYPPRDRRDDYPPPRRDDYPPRDRRDDYPPRRDDYPPRDRRDDYPPSRRDDYDRRYDDHPPPSRNPRDDYPPPKDAQPPKKDNQPAPPKAQSTSTSVKLQPQQPLPKKEIQPRADLDEADYPSLGASRKPPAKKENKSSASSPAPTTAPAAKKEIYLGPTPPANKEVAPKKEVYLGPTPPANKDSASTKNDVYLGPKPFKSAAAPPQQRRERGKVSAIKDRYGFIKSNSGESLYFHFSSVEGGVPLREREDVEFNVVPERSGPTAVNIRSLGVVSILESEEKQQKNEKADASKSLLPAWMMSSSSMPSSHGATSSVQHEEPPHHEEESLSKRRMLEWIKTIDEGDPETLILHMNVLAQVLNSDEMPFTVVQPLVLILTRDELLDSERTDKVYNLVLESKFLRNPRNLRAYILKLCSIKNPSAEDSRAFQQVLVLLQELMDRCRAYRDLPLDALDPARCTQFPSTTVSRVEKLHKTATSIRAESTQSMINTNWAPQEEDFRDMPIFPTTEEILGIKSGELNPRLRANVVDGKFDNPMHYLDTHFRLLREDCLQPLREGIQAYRNSADTRDVRVYTNVRIRGIMCARTGLIYRVSFETDRPVMWSKSKRLIYGSLLCLSPDKFDTLLWATVSQRDDAVLEAKQQIDIQFPAGYEARFDPSMTYTMAESVTTYFEAYQHVLRALQQLDLERFPFKEYLINCQSSVQPPSYLRGAGTVGGGVAGNTGGADKYNLSSVMEGGKTTFNLLGPWPDLETTMDNSQLSAFKQALCKEFAIIQGPPGTGKTFVGLKVMRSLLDNRTLRRKGPILVVCFTNHALDQFLEGILEFEENIVRIGSRSKSERLRARNIRQLTHETLKWGHQHKARKSISQQLELLQKEITELVADMNRKEISVEDILKHIPDDQYDSLVGMRRNPSTGELHDILKHWLGEDPQKILLPKPKQPTKTNGKTNSQNGKPPAAALPKVEVGNWADDAEDEVDDETLTNLQQERMVGDDETAGPSGESVVELRAMGDFAMSFRDMPSKEVLECDDIWKLKPADRKKLYKYWAAQSMRRSEEPLINLSAQYDRYCHERATLEDDMKIEVLANSAVIGMTTTGVAKFHNLLQAVQPEIIIVEEAAEVLEAHIVVALSQSTKHVILIGDHEQLRPSTAVYQLSTKFHLDVSLFERMVRNNVEQVTLLRQRRMRPDISKLISPLYPKLDNHPYVTTYPDVMGVASNVYLVSHSVEEEKDQDTNSKSNTHEALFLARLCEYLLLQGYKPEQITVLTPYCGQVRLLHKEFRKASSANLRITSVDNFQGEEADIILLSLVRSNAQGDIGFLKVSNRVCVALSRAKIGFYMIGNTAMLQRSKLWRTVLDILDSKQMVGPALALRCQNHPQTTTYVSTEVDFKKVSDGGCSLPCKAVMTCGHVCPRLCHPYSHDKLLCQAPCTRRHIECGHLCERRCFEDCGLCLVMVDKDLPCGHTARAPCAEPRDSVRCMEPCEKRLPCRHPCPKPCGEKCPRTCAVKVERDLPCGHTVEVPCSDDIRKFKCPKPCLSYLPCGHKCIGTCGECSRMKSNHIACAECNGITVAS